MLLDNNIVVKSNTDIGMFRYMITTERKEFQKTVNRKLSNRKVALYKNKPKEEPFIAIRAANGRKCYLQTNREEHLKYNMDNDRQLFEHLRRRYGNHLLESWLGQEENRENVSRNYVVL